jgi:hypothetical protein
VGRGDGEDDAEADVPEQGDVAEHDEAYDGEQALVRLVPGGRQSPDR